MSIRDIMNSIKEFLNQPIIDKVLNCVYMAFITFIFIAMLYIVWRIAKEGAYDYVLNRYDYKIKIIVRDSALFIYFKPFWLYPKLIDYSRVRDLGIRMAKKKAPKAYKNTIKYIYTVNMYDLMIYKESDLDRVV